MIFDPLQSMNAFSAGANIGSGIRQAQTNTKIGNAFASGDYTGAAKTAFGEGNLAAGMEIQKYGQGLQDAEAEKRRRAMMAAGMALLEKPEGPERQAFLPQVMGTLQAAGIDLPEETLSRLDLSNAGIQGTLKSLQDPDSLMKQYQEAQAPYTLAPGARRMAGSEIIAENPAARGGPNSTLGKLAADLQSGLITQQQFDAEVARMSAPRAPLVQNIVGDGGPGSRPIIDKPPKDMQAVWDEAAGTYRFEPIPGSETAREREGSALKSATSIRLADQQMELMNTSIDKAIGQADFWSAGLMAQATSGIGATPARNLRATLDTIMANIGFEKLQEMRETSPTGGALGNVTERELAFLQSVRGSLDQIQDPAQLREVLGQVKESLQIIHEIRKMNMQGNMTNSGERVPTGDARQAAPPAGGFDASLLEFMTPEERALFEDAQ